MTIQIIKKGKKPEDITYTDSCHYCDTLFTFNRPDVKSQNDGRNGDDYFLRCPFCNIVVWLNKPFTKYRKPESPKHPKWDAYGQ